MANVFCKTFFIWWSANFPFVHTAVDISHSWHEAHLYGNVVLFGFRIHSLSSPERQMTAEVVQTHICCLLLLMNSTRHQFKPYTHTHTLTHTHTPVQTHTNTVCHFSLSLFLSFFLSILSPQGNSEEFYSFTRLVGDSQKRDGPSQTGR